MTVAVVPAHVDDLEALARDPAEFAARVGSAVPAGWPEYPATVEFTINRIREHPAEAQWWLHLVFDDRRLVGSGGFAGPPDDGVVEIGYEIARELRGRGYATAAARAMTAKALAAGVHTVIAHTVPQENPSTGVLRKLGFDRTGEVSDPDEGTVWKWVLEAP